VKKTPRELAKRLTLAGASVLTGLLVGELTLLLVAPLPLRDEVQVYPARANRPAVTYERNAFGLRSLSMRTRSKPEGTLRVIVLGASTTDEANRNTEDTWTAKLEGKLRGALASEGVVVEVAGYGRGGLTAPTVLSWARQELADFEADLVVTLLGVNDLAWKGGPGYAYQGLTIDTVAVGRPLAARIKWACQQASQICRRARLAKMRFDTWRALHGGRAVTWGASDIPDRRAQYRSLPKLDSLSRDPDPIVEFSDAMEALVTYARGLGVEVLVLGQPVLWKPLMTPEEQGVLWFTVQTATGPSRPSTGWLEAEMDRYNAVQADHAERVGAAYLDLDRSIPKTLDYYTDDCHYTPFAEEVVAEAVFPAALELLRKRLAREAAPGGEARKDYRLP
jgi:lysophospholipase L1-like esterase